MSTVIVLDLETGPQSDEQLRRVYREKTVEQFTATCDKRWKPDTVAEKYAEYRTTGFEKFRDGAALEAHTAQIVAIGLKSCRGVKIIPAATNDADRGGEGEFVALRSFWTLYEKAAKDRRKIIGHYLLGFDMPMLCRRSMILGVAIPGGLMDDNRRYWSKTFIDTLTVWKWGNYQDSISLHDLSIALGGHGKPDNCQGTEFARMYLSGDPVQREIATQYLVNDLEMTWFCAERLGLL